MPAEVVRLGDVAASLASARAAITTTDATTPFTVRYDYLTTIKHVQNIPRDEISY